MTLGSLFDGIGGFPLAAVRNGITPVWASEVEPFPMEVTSIRFPDMLHVGDITKLHGANLPVVDVITGGSPCQDLSIASGNRKGLAGERSGLFLEQIRIIKEMRKQDGRRGQGNGDTSKITNKSNNQRCCENIRNSRNHNEYRDGNSGNQAAGPSGIDGTPSAQFLRPRYMVWENVLGVFSSGVKKGEDFHRVLEEVCRIPEEGVSIPGPPGGSWTPAGLIMGEGFSVAWRVLNAQFWGLAQRRHRIFLVADFSGHSAGEILFESHRVWGHYQAVQKERQRASGSVGESIIGAGRAGAVICLMDQGGDRMDDYWNRTGTLLSDCRSNPPIIMKDDRTSGVQLPVSTADIQPPVAAESSVSGSRLPIVMATGQGGSEIGFDLCPTLMAGHDQPVLFNNHGKDGRYTGPVKTVQTITAAWGMGGNNTPLAVAHGIAPGEQDIHAAGNHASVNQEPDSYISEPYCIAGNIINRQMQNGGNGCGFRQGISYTLTTGDLLT